MLKLYRKFTVLIIASAFIALTVFGLNMGMDMRQDGTMSGCVFDQSVTCPMNYQDHINHWQQTVTVAQPIQNFLAALVALFTLGGAALLFSSLLTWRWYAQEAHLVPQSVHKQREITAKLSDHILQALSNGRLNPRLYNFSKAIR